MNGAVVRHAATADFRRARLAARRRSGLIRLNYANIRAAAVGARP